MRVVLDTNVLVSGFSSPHGTPGQLLSLWLLGAYDLVLSQPILTETERTLREPYFAARLTGAQQAANLALLRREAEIVEISSTVRDIAPSPADDLILATAVSAGAAYLVTGDRRLAAVGRYRHVEILSPRDFLTMLSPADEEDQGAELSP